MAHKVRFHGAFGTRKKAVEKKKKIKGATIKKITVNGKTRFAVMSRK